MFKRMESYYCAWSQDALKCSVIKAATEEIASEIAAYIYGEPNKAYRVYDNATDEILYFIKKFDETNIKQGYISVSNEIIEYKTRSEIIDDFLLNDNDNDKNISKYR